MKTKVSAFIGIIAAMSAFCMNNLLSAPGADEWAVFFQGCIYALESGILTFGVTYVALYAWEKYAPHHFKKTMKKIYLKISELSEYYSK